MIERIRLWNTSFIHNSILPILVNDKVYCFCFLSIQYHRKKRPKEGQTCILRAGWRLNPETRCFWVILNPVLLWNFHFIIWYLLSVLCHLSLSFPLPLLQKWTQHDLMLLYLYMNIWCMIQDFWGVSSTVYYIRGYICDVYIRPVIICLQPTYFC